MQKFTDLKFTPEEKEEYLYDGFFKVRKEGDKEIIERRDTVAIIPYLMDEGCTILKKETNDTFSQEGSHLSCINAVIMSGENLNDAILRKMKSYGFMFNLTYNSMDTLGSFYIDKNINSKCHVVYLPLHHNEYSIHNINNNNKPDTKLVKVENGSLEALKPSDLLTAYCIEVIQKIVI